MQKRIISAAALAMLAMPANAGVLDASYTSFFTFGDSLSDDGKFGPLLSPPSLGGRFTNDLTYAEIVSADFTVEENYALGGATAGPANTSDYPPFLQPFATLSRQVDIFIGSGAPATAGDDPLVLIFMGSNDIFQNAADPDYDVTVTADYVLDAVDRIAALDGFDDFIVPFLPGTTSETFGALRRQFNDYIAGELAERELAGLSILSPQFDVVTGQIQADPAAYGITTIGPCAPTFFNPPDAANCTFTGLDADGVPQYDLSLADAFSLADPVHPSGTVHRAWADYLLKTVTSDPGPSPVPLPATGLLLAGGIGAFGLARRRRARS